MKYRNNVAQEIFKTIWEFHKSEKLYHIVCMPAIDTQEKTLTSNLHLKHQLQGLAIGLQKGTLNSYGLLRGGIHIHIAMLNVILTFSSQPSHPPTHLSENVKCLKTDKISEKYKFSSDLGYVKVFCFLVLYASCRYHRLPTAISLTYWFLACYFKGNRFWACALLIRAHSQNLFLFLKQFYILLEKYVDFRKTQQ